MAQSCALTTTDNPYDPFTQYDAWYRFDEGKGYHSCAYLARIARTSDQLSDAENEQELERAIDDIIKYDPLDQKIRTGCRKHLQKSKSRYKGFASRECIKALAAFFAQIGRFYLWLCFCNAISFNSKSPFA